MNPETDLIFYKDKDGSYMSGGYKIQSELFEHIISSKHNGLESILDKQQGGSLLISDAFKDLVIPAGLLFLQQTYTTKNIENKDGFSKNVEVCSEDLYDRLVNMVSPTKKKNFNRKSRKMKISKNITKNNENKIVKKQKTRRNIRT